MAERRDRLGAVEPVTPDQAPGPPPPRAEPAPPPAGREAGAGYAAAARALSAVPPLGQPELPAADEWPALDAALLLRAGLGPLLPGGPGGLVLPLALALLRPDPRRWLGAERLAALAASLALAEPELSALLEAVPPLPASLGEPAAWQGRAVPLLGPSGGLLWLALFWRPDRRRRDRHALAARLVLPATGRVELRARLEEARLDAVLETAQPLPRPVLAALQEGFAGVLRPLRLQGHLTLRHSGQEGRT
ncbi:hypothetical protein [Pseudoroseomonas cervicalis]|uniref:hypothetical protein n=1 Tax=Teichococcus cervicalis TaxID=204525 RepID=UPI00277F882D|nr:hypothetical protein [Pseudoroseomonas cervicalis]MDQ1077558.1 hypothetical protein [Pseudoroseomonas cervicalis]